MSAYGSGLSNPSPPIYIDDTKINLVSTVSNLENRNFPSWVRWSAINNLNIPKNFLLKAWFYPSRVSTKLLKLSNDEVNLFDNDTSTTVSLDIPGIDTDAVAELSLSDDDQSSGFTVTV